MNSKKSHNFGRLALQSPRVVIAGAVILMVLGGCSDSRSSRGFPGEAVDLQLGERTIRVEIASDDLTRKQGLMYRKSMPEHHGMLFVFARVKTLSFYMKNTLIPLSIAFLDDDGKILQIEDMKPKDETSTVSMMRCRYALEMNQGWFQKNGIGVGDSIVDFQAQVARFDAS